MEEDIFLSVTKFLDSQEIEYSLNNDSILLNIQSTDPKEVILKFKKPKNSLEFIISDLSIPSYSEYPKNLILSLAKENEFLFGYQLTVEIVPEKIKVLTRRLRLFT